VIMMALGLKKVLGYVGGDEGHMLTDPIYGVPLAALYGGARCTCSRTGFSSGMWPAAVNRGRIAVIMLVFVLIPLVAVLPALLTLAVLAAVLGAP
jgi:hypothetical protein